MGSAKHNQSAKNQRFRAGGVASSRRQFRQHFGATGYLLISEPPYAGTCGVTPSWMDRLSWVVAPAGVRICVGCSSMVGRLFGAQAVRNPRAYDSASWNSRGSARSAWAMPRSRTRGSAIRWPR